MQYRVISSIPAYCLHILLIFLHIFFAYFAYRFQWQRLKPEEVSLDMAKRLIEYKEKFKLNRMKNKLSKAKMKVLRIFEIKKGSVEEQIILNFFPKIYYILFD